MRYRLLILCLMILMTGCSRTQFAYHQLDWLIPYYLKSYLPLTDQQSDYLDDHLDKVLSWHCNEQVGEYAKLLRQTDRHIQSDQMTGEQFVHFVDQIKLFWRQIMIRMNPVIVKLLYEADQQQLQALFEALDESNREWFDEYKEQSQAELYEDYYEKMLDILEDWMGTLDIKQKKFLMLWVKSYEPIGETGYVMRRVWQLRLQNLTLNRGNKLAFVAGIEEMFVYPRKTRTREYQRNLDHNQKVTIDLLVAISRSLYPAQRQHLSKKIDAIALDFEELVCELDKQE